MFFILRVSVSIRQDLGSIASLDCRLVDLYSDSSDVSRKLPQSDNSTLSALSSLLNTFNSWIENYNSYYPANATLGSNFQVIVENIMPESREENRKKLLEKVDLLESEFTHLLDRLNPITNKIEREIQNNIIQNDITSYCLLIQTDEILTRRLPWHLYTRKIERHIYDLEEREIEIGIGFIDNHKTHNIKIDRLSWLQRITNILFSPKHLKVQIIVGQGIDQIRFEEYLRTWKEFPENYNRDYKFGDWLDFNQPIYASDSLNLPQKLRNTDFSILIYLGHSSSEYERDAQNIMAGRIIYSRINQQNVEFTLEQLVDSLNNNQNNHQLLIFNSCKGLGLAQDLSNLRRLATNTGCVVMKEPLIDGIALIFIQELLLNLKINKQLHLALRKAQRELQNSMYPSAGMLPALCLSSSPKILAIDKYTLRKKIKLQFNYRRIYVRPTDFLLGYSLGIIYSYFENQDILFDLNYSNVYFLFVTVLIFIIFFYDLLPNKKMCLYTVVSFFTYILVYLIENPYYKVIWIDITIHGIVFGLIATITIPLIESML